MGYFSASLFQLVGFNNKTINLTRHVIVRYTVIVIVGLVFEPIGLSELSLHTVLFS